MGSFCALVVPTFSSVSLAPLSRPTTPHNLVAPTCLSFHYVYFPLLHPHHADRDLTAYPAVPVSVQRKKSPDLWKDSSVSESHFGEASTIPPNAEFAQFGGTLRQFGFLTFVHKATGPISARICSVLEAGWKQVAPCFWKVPGTELSSTTRNLLTASQKTFERQVCGKAAGHTLSKGREGYHHILCQDGSYRVAQTA